MSKNLEKLKKDIMEKHFNIGEKEVLLNWLMCELDFDCDDCVNEAPLGSCDRCDDLKYDLDEAKDEIKNLQSDLDDSDKKIEKLEKQLKK